MALSTCVKCGGGLFELREAEPRDSNYKFIYVQCSGCGGVAGVTEYFNTGQLLTKLEKDLKDLRGVVDAVEHNVRVIASHL